MKRLPLSSPHKPRRIRTAIPRACATTRRVQHSRRRWRQSRASDTRFFVRIFRLNQSNFLSLRGSVNWYKNSLRRIKHDSFIGWTGPCSSLRWLNMHSNPLHDSRWSRKRGVSQKRLSKAVHYPLSFTLLRLLFFPITFTMHLLRKLDDTSDFLWQFLSRTVS